MSADDPPKLPLGASVQARAEGGYELRIVAPDADELIWRLHDVVLTIQTGTFEAVLQSLDSGMANDAAPAE